MDSFEEILKYLEAVLHDLVNFNRLAYFKDQQDAYNEGIYAKKSVVTEQTEYGEKTYAKISDMTAALLDKVDKQDGYSLMSDAERSKLAGIATGATKTEVIAETDSTGIKIATITNDGIPVSIHAPTNAYYVLPSEGNYIGRTAFQISDMTLYVYTGEWEAVYSLSGQFFFEATEDGAIVPTEEGAFAQVSMFELNDDGEVTPVKKGSFSSIALFECDTSGGVMPKTAINIDEFFEYDSNDALMPVLTPIASGQFELDDDGAIMPLLSPQASEQFDIDNTGAIMPAYMSMVTATDSDIDALFADEYTRYEKGKTITLGNLSRFKRMQDALNALLYISVTDRELFALRSEMPFEIDSDGAITPKE